MYLKADGNFNTLLVQVCMKLPPSEQNTNAFVFIACPIIFRFRKRKVLWRSTWSLQACTLPMTL